MLKSSSESTISVIVPVYGTEQYLDRCLNSLLNQSYPYLEIIVVNDGSPGNVADKMAELLTVYESKDIVSINNIIQFHYEFERIHPFQDGNGRVGRLIALKECLRHNITPFIIEDSKKMFYYRGLAEWQTEPGYLTDTCLDGQDTFKRLLALFGL